MGGSADVKGKKVIIIEDDPLLYSLLADKMLELHREGVDVYPTLNAEEGLQKAREVKPDLIMLDLLLPGLTGFEFLEQLRREPGIEKTPVVILTNLSDDSDKARAKQLGAVGYMLKADYSLTDIVEAVKEVLQGRALPVISQKSPVIRKTPLGNVIML